MAAPVSGHLAELNPPSWHVCFAAQLLTDPALREMTTAEARKSPTIRAAAEGLARCLPELPGTVRAERHDMMRTLIVHTCADRERTVAADSAAWHTVEADLTDVIVGLLAAPCPRAETAVPGPVPSRW